jgi:uncharacterized membrane protein
MPHDALPSAALDPAAAQAVAVSIEVASLFLFLWAAFESGRARALATCAVYGWVLEAANIAIFGTYVYPEGLYVFRAGTVPLYIPLLWAVILHSSMAISDRWGLARWAKPFADGLLALLIDIAVDAIAIRLGLWRWRLPSEGGRFLRFDEGWFGVPPGNLMAWMWVAASYSYFRRGLEERKGCRGIRQFNVSVIQWVAAWRGWREIAVIALSYAGLFAGMFLSGAARRLAGIADDDQTSRLWILAAHVAAFAVLSVWGSKEVVMNPKPQTPNPELISYRAGRWAMHLSFAALLVGTGAWRNAPALIAVSAGAIAGEWIANPIPLIRPGTPPPPSDRPAGRRRGPAG